MRYILSRKDTPIQLAAQYGIPLCMLLLHNKKAIWRPGNAVNIPLPCNCAQAAQEAVFYTVPHRVKEGESIAALAKHYGTVMHQILQVNHLPHPAALKAGMQIQIPCLTKGFMVYSYKMTDDLAAVATRYAMTAEELLRINQVQAVYPGMQLIVRRKE